MFRRIALTFSTVVVFLAVSVIPLFSLGGGTTNADFLKIGVGARSSAMGEACAAVGDDSSASFWNPAGISQVDSWNFTLMHLNWYMNSFYEYFSGAFAVDNTTTLGLSVNYFWIPPFNSTKDSFGNILESGDTPVSYDLAVTVSGAKILGNLYTKDFTIGNISVGANLTLIRRQILDVALDSILTADVGVIANVTELIKVALVLQDVGTNLGDDPTPFNVRLGTAFDIPVSKEFGILLSGDINKPIDISNPEYAKWFFNLGMEMRILDMVYIRGGYKLGREDESFTAGGGFGIPNVGNIDYAYMPHKELGDTHRISLSVSLGNPILRPVIGSPSPPGKVSAIAGDKVVSVGWDPNPESNIVGYNVYYRKKGETTFGKLNKEPIMEEAKFRAVLNNDIEYEFAATAINNRKLESVKSDLVTATPKKYVAKKPDVVEGIYTTVKDSSIIVSWDESREEYVSGYNLYYKKAGDKKYKKLNSNILRKAKATLAGLKPGIKYYFMVTAISKDSLESDFSDIVSAQIAQRETYY